MWIVYALLAAVFAALTSVLAKIGIENVNSHLATAIRTIVVLVLAWMIVWMTGAHHGLKTISTKSWWFLCLSGAATGLSWLCFYKAIQIGDVSRVTAIDKSSLVLTILFAAMFLGEPLSAKVVIGVLLITIGTLIMMF
ncbi:EamA family transporter [Anoxybacillus geothermalis]|uniref:EamA family transporter n=1 Tax=Geobacillus zalihae TaxID=213419 RepID=UPI00076403B3|nr:EamA family transporter [Geobacillus zalihae]MED0655184.1 EamA family transporter [Anoxybacillus geothermalis]QOR85917.1 EamA family transporter [Geobacillus stearothermophilus]